MASERSSSPPKDLCNTMLPRARLIHNQCRLLLDIVARHTPAPLRHTHGVVSCRTRLLSGIAPLPSSGRLMGLRGVKAAMALCHSAIVIQVIQVIKTFQSRWPRRPRQSADQTADQTEITSSSGGRPGGGPGGGSLCAGGRPGGGPGGSSSKSSIGRPGGGPSGGSSMSGGGPSHNGPPCPPCTGTWRATR